MKLKIGYVAPDFTLPSHLGKDITLSDLRGNNVVIVFYPLAWTPVWTSQIPSYEAEYASFTGLNAQVLGISVDHIPCIQAWAQSLGGINYPLLSDFWPHGEVARKYGVFRDDGRSERAIFIVDNQGIIRYIDIHDIDQQPDNDQLRQVLNEIDPNVEGQKVNKSVAPATLQIPDAGIVLFCTPWCHDCRKARKWLKDRNLEFVEIDITKNTQGAEKVMGWAGGNRTTPTFDIDGWIIVDWDEAELQKALQENGYLRES